MAKKYRFYPPNKQGLVLDFNSQEQMDDYVAKTYPGYHSVIVNNPENDSEQNYTFTAGELPPITVTGKVNPELRKKSNEYQLVNTNWNLPPQELITTFGSERDKYTEPTKKEPVKTKGIFTLSDWAKSIPSNYWNSQAYKNYRFGSDISAALFGSLGIPVLNNTLLTVPEITGALNLWGGYEGAKGLNKHLPSLINNLQQGKLLDAGKDLAASGFDALMAYPSLKVVQQASKVGGRVLAGNYMANQFSKMSPKYNFQYDWQTGKFTLTPKPGTLEGVTSVTIPEQARGLLGVPRALGTTESVGVPAARTYTSMNEVADALEAGEFPTNSQIEAIAPQVVEPSTVASGTRRVLPPMNEFGHYGNPSSLTTEQLQDIIDYNLETDLLPSEVLEFYINELGVRQRAQEVTQSLDDLPPAPAEVNNVAEVSSTRPYGDFDWDGYITQAEPVASPTPQVRSYDELLRNNGYLRNPDESWTNYTTNETFTFGNNGEITFNPGYGMPNIQLQPDEIERFIRTRYDNTFNLDGPFRSLNDFVIRNQSPLDDIYLSGDNSWIFNYKHPNGFRIPIRLRQEPNGSIGISMNDGETTFIPTTPETTTQEVYDGIMNYVRNIQIPELTADQRTLIQNIFPNEVPISRIGLAGTPYSTGFMNDRGGSFVYNPLEQTFSMRGVGYRRFNNEPIANLTPETLAPIKAPTIITSSNLPIFSEISQGTDWGKVLGIDSKYNSQIDFGLQRPRPTEQDVIRVLGSDNLTYNTPNRDSVQIHADNIFPRYSKEYPLIQPTNEVPTLHINILPWGDYLDGDASRWLTTQMKKINGQLKGIDLTSTGNMNPTLSRFISDLKTDPNLSNLDKHNILVDLIKNPKQYFREYPNGGDYSPYSFTENAIKEGSSSKKYFTEPSILGTLGRFNSYGDNVGLAKANRGGLGLELLKSMNPPLTGLENLSRKIEYPAMDNFIQTKFPYLVDRFGYNLGTTPFVFTTVRKKGGKLVKKKLINGNKTCK